MISSVVLVLAESFGEGMDGMRVARAIGRGLESEGRFRCDLCPLEEAEERGSSEEHQGAHSWDGSAQDKHQGARQRDQRGRERESGARALLDGLDFDRRMRGARALVIAQAHLDDRGLAGSVAFEAATRARQAGVPAYAVTGSDELDPFEARIVDLQVILEARTPRALTRAGAKLAELV